MIIIETHFSRWINRLTFFIKDEWRVSGHDMRKN